MQVVASAKTSNEQTLFWRNLALTIGLGGSGLISLLLPLTGLTASSSEDAGFWVLAVSGLGLLIGGIWFGRLSWLHIRARRSQEDLCRVLNEALGQEFIYFRNLSLPGTRSVGEIDGVLLGIHGALVLQIEAGRGEFACEGDTWYSYPTGTASEAKRHRMADSPSWVAIRAGREVKAWLSVRDLPLVPVRPVVVLNGGKMRSMKRPSCPVIELASLQSFIHSNLLQTTSQQLSEPISGGIVEQIAQRLQG